VHESPRKHQKKENPTTEDKRKAVDLEPSEDIEYINVDMEEIDMGEEDIDVFGVGPISKLPPYVPPHRGTGKVPKDVNERKITLFTTLLPKKITFEGPHLVHVSLLKMEDWDLEDTEHFPHLATNTFMHRIFYKDWCDRTRTMTVDKRGG